jgi:hypothetical protein
MKTLLYVALLLALLSSCALRKGVSEASLADNPHLRYDIIEKSQLTDGSMIAFYIQHSDTSSVFPESVILCLLDNDTLLYNTYFGHMRPLKPASFGITNPIPMEADVVAAYGAEFAETGFFVYVEKQSGNYILREIKTSPRDGEGIKNTVIKSF